MKDGYYWLNNELVLVDDDMAFELAQASFIGEIPEHIKEEDLELIRERK